MDVLDRHGARCPEGRRELASERPRAEGVEQVHQIARRGHQLSQGLETIEAEDAHSELARLETTLGDGTDPDPMVERTREALRSQLETAERLTALLEDARSRLKLLDARLDESVARAIELSLQVDDADDLRQIDADIDNVVSEMEALRQALDETDQVRRGTPDN
jgi:chromosome segregation ATPase